MSLERFLKNLTKNNEINAFVTLNPEAEEEFRALARRGVSPFLFGVKDVINTAGIRTTMGSRLYADYIPTTDARIVQALKLAGGVVAGKTNTHEFASGATTTSSIFGPTRNPLDTTRIAGGSSGGSAAAVGAQIVELALGTDTAGSVRIPASFCGVYGLKTTRGILSLEGVLPLAPSYDALGFLASTPDELEKVCTLCMGEKTTEERRRLVFGVPAWAETTEGIPEPYRDQAERVIRGFERWLDGLEDLDIVRLERLERSSVDSHFGAIRYAEASSVHLPNRERWNECFPDVRQLLEKGLEVRAVDYIQALSAMRVAYAEFRAAAAGVDAVVTPTTPIIPPPISQVVGNEAGELRSVLTRFTTYASFLGLPALSVPALPVDGFKLGAQLMCDKGGDSRLVSYAKRMALR